MQNQMKCDGCGQQFGNRNDLQKHEATCSAMEAKRKSGQSQPLTHSAGGQSQRS
jgi:hypothetical protein